MCSSKCAKNPVHLPECYFTRQSGQKVKIAFSPLNHPHHRETAADFHRAFRRHQPPVSMGNGAEVFVSEATRLFSLGQIDWLGIAL